MDHLFNNPAFPQRGMLINPKIAKIHNDHRVAVDIFRNFNQEGRVYPSSTVINNSNIFAKLIIEFHRHITDDEVVPRNVYASVKRDLVDICTAHGITHKNTYGEIHNDSFISEYCNIVSLDMESKSSISPVVIFTHPNTDITISSTQYIPKDYSKGITVVGVDLPLMAYQWATWVKSENELPFLYFHLFPRLVENYIHISHRNRLLAYANDDVDDLSKVGIDNGRVDDVIKTSITEARQTRPTSLYNAMSMLPSLGRRRYINDIPPFAAPTQYEQWISITIFTDWLLPILTVSSNSLRYDEKLIDRMKFVQRKLKYNNYFVTSLTSATTLTSNKLKLIYKHLDL